MCGSSLFQASGLCTPKFIATSVRMWKQSVSINKWVKEMHAHKQPQSNPEKECPLSSLPYYNRDEPGEHDGRWNEPVTEGRIPRDSTHPRSLKSSDSKDQRVGRLSRGWGKGDLSANRRKGPGVQEKQLPEVCRTAWCLH